MTKPGLLDLPAHIRSRIFSYCNLDLGRHIHLTVDEKEEDDEEADGQTQEKKEANELSKLRLPWIRCSSQLQRKIDKPPQDCFCHLLPQLQILLVCRTFYTEACSYFYPRNEFQVSRTWPGGLTAVFSLEATALGSLSSLKILLNECRNCGKDEGCQSYLHERVQRQEHWEDDLPNLLGCVSRHDQSFISEWTKICEHLRRFITPSRLRLCLVCDVANLETARRITQPMLSLPTLSACSIRFSADSDSALRSLARLTAQRLTGSLLPQSLSPTLPSLPYDLIAEVLRHTDLVAPYDLQWTPKSGLICRKFIPNEMMNDLFQYLGQEPFTNPCEMCEWTHLLSSQTLPNSYRGASHSACACWRFPTEFFLLNRQCRLLAMQIFYTSNHFYIMRCGCRRNFPCCEIPKVPTFVQGLPLDAIPYLRSLQFVIPELSLTPDVDDWFGPDRQAVRDWAKDVQFLAKRATLSRLSITIDESLGWTDHYDYPSMSEHDERTMVAWEREKQIVHPLAILKGLKNLLVHFITQATCQVHMVSVKAGHCSLKDLLWVMNMAVEWKESTMMSLGLPITFAIIAKIESCTKEVG